MHEVSWFYLYGVGGLIYGLGSWAVWKQGGLDFGVVEHRRTYIWSTVCLCGFAAMHALFQFVLPYVG